MDLAIRNRWFTIRGSSSVTDLEGKEICLVKGRFWTFTRKKFIQALDGTTKYVVRNKFWRLFAYQAMVYDAEGKQIAYIRRKIFSFHDRYLIQCTLGEMEIQGNILCHDYDITLNGKVVGHISRKISLRDSFVLHLENSDDYLLYVALVIAIDNITDQRGYDASNS